MYYLWEYTLIRFAIIYVLVEFRSMRRLVYVYFRLHAINFMFLESFFNRKKLFLYKNKYAFVSKILRRQLKMLH